MNTAYFDCFSGASGDMIVGALIDAGASLEGLRDALSRLNVAGYAISASKITKQALAATRFEVTVESADQPHRHLRDIVAILESSDLGDRVKQHAIRVFQRLAEAEAQVHGTDVNAVHFHEVGAVDAIVDVVATVSALDQLQVQRVICSPICVGSGTVQCDHGVLPVPAPATAVLLRGQPIAECDEPGELTTPTGAALLTTLAESFGPLPSMTIRTVGYGAGTRDGVHRPNVLRVILGDPSPAGSTDEVVVLETAVDDTTGEAVGHCLERLFDAGALDAYCLPIYMKKSRPGLLLTVLSSVAEADRLEAVIFAETTTFGVRRYRARRTKLDREHRDVDTPWGRVRVKIGRRGRDVVTVAPEYEDCRRVAADSRVALRDVLNAALRGWEAVRGDEP